MDRPERELQARHGGRRVFMVIYYAIVAIFIVVTSINVIWQVWAPVLARHPREDCRAGLYDLARAVERARAAAQTASQQGEDVAVSRFRSALGPEWSRNAAISASCHEDAGLASALDAIERLRYAEERAVRREVNELAPLRRRVDELLARDLARPR